ncbi:MAG: dihydroxyacetone kinase subunit L [Clostridiales bacterium]|jgi:dihydroxyacetone kinase-like protein|nr:dihydroxyacetone kinase subunit L [Clostridiales bacterium]
MANAELIKNIILQMAQEIEGNKEYLTGLDAAIGDNDHGINMNKGFKNAVIKINGLGSQSISEIIKAAGMAMISHVGGSAGPLYGTLFLKAAGAAKDKDEIGLLDFTQMLREGIDGVKARGKSERHEKTMLDVLIPALEALEESAVAGGSAKQAFEKALAAAEEGVLYTKTIVATKGRASYLGERSLGHIDPGAMSSCLLIKAIYDLL